VFDEPDIEGNGAIFSNGEAPRKVQNKYLDSLTCLATSRCAIHGIRTQDAPRFERSLRDTESYAHTP